MPSLELKRMYKEFGRNYNAKTCGTCCNHRDEAGGSCIAYGVRYCSSWPSSSQACDLYNRPFAAQRPRRVELGVFYEQRSRKAAETDGNDQISFF